MVDPENVESRIMERKCYINNISISHSSFPLELTNNSFFNFFLHSTQCNLILLNRRFITLVADKAINDCFWMHGRTNYVYCENILAKESAEMIQLVGHLLAKCVLLISL